MRKDPLILYHDDQDGFCSAFLLWVAFGGNGEYRPVQYSQAAPIDDCAWRDVYIVDFSYPRDVLIQMEDKSKSIVVLDHHKTAEEELSGLQFCVFDATKSGASLTWDLVGDQIVEKHGRMVADRILHLVNYVEDRDLWKWSLVGSRAINAYIYSSPTDFDEWWLVFTGLNWGDEAEPHGQSILRNTSRQVEVICGHAIEVWLDGHHVFAVNTPLLQSEVAAKLASNRPFGVAWFQRNDGKFQYSLRSTPTGADVSEIAKRHGGGGHARAAGFESSKLLWV